jgi:hypothetical protein
MMILSWKKILRTQCCLVEFERINQVPTSMLGRQLYQMIIERLPVRPGARLSVQNGSSPLSLRLTLKQQGMQAGFATLSCVYLPVNLLSAWKYLEGEKVDDEEFVLQGLTHIAGVKSVDVILELPNSLQHLTLSKTFDESLAGVHFPRWTSGIEFWQWIQPELEWCGFAKGFAKRVFWSKIPQTLRWLDFATKFAKSVFWLPLRPKPS